MDNTTLRIARLARDDAGEPIGAAVFITADELAALGVDTSADAVAVTIESELLRLCGADSCRQVDIETEKETNLDVEK